MVVRPTPTVIDMGTTVVAETERLAAAFEEKKATLIDAMDHKHAEYDYFLNEADRRGFPAPILRGLARFLDSRPASRRDNVNRPYAPLWSALRDLGT